MEQDVRIDKYLWAIRVFKTRSEAADACKNNRVKVNGSDAKPSRLIKPGDKIEVRKAAVHFTYRVKAMLGSRVGAALVPEYAEDLTPQSEKDKLVSPVETFFVTRDRGTGRPTKKDRRVMNVMMLELLDDESSDFDDDDDDDDEE